LTGNTANRNVNVGFDVVDGSSNNMLSKNSGCLNTVVDALDDGTGTGNFWQFNHFCTRSGI
jgi:hypothetical protein